MGKSGSEWEGNVENVTCLTVGFWSDTSLEMEEWIPWRGKCDMK